jgi:hypothetical protein
MQTFDEFGAWAGSVADGRLPMDKGLGWMDNECGVWKGGNR